MENLSIEYLYADLWQNVLSERIYLAHRLIELDLELYKAKTDTEKSLKQIELDQAKERKAFLDKLLNIYKKDHPSERNYRNLKLYWNDGYPLSESQKLRIKAYQYSNSEEYKDKWNSTMMSAGYIFWGIILGPVILIWLICLIKEPSSGGIPGFFIAAFLSPIWFPICSFLAQFLALNKVKEAETIIEREIYQKEPDTSTPVITSLQAGKALKDFKDLSGSLKGGWVNK